MKPEEEATALAKLVKAISAMPPEAQRRVMSYLEWTFDSKAGTKEGCHNRSCQDE